MVNIAQKVIICGEGLDKSAAAIDPFAAMQNFYEHSRQGDDP